MELNPKIRASLAAVALAAGAAGAAGGIPSGHVTGVYCGYYSGANMCSVYFDKKISNPPASGSETGCNSNVSVGAEQTHRFQFRLDDVGKGILSIALSAQATGAEVQADGTGACSIWGDTETLNMLFMLPPQYPNFP
jgi:hypothetical protein